MEKERTKLKSFTDLDAWRYGHELVLDIYRVTKKFPDDERFGLTNQLRRAIVSFTSNIAEGFSRNSFKEKLQFYSMALGSLSEVQNQILISRDLGYLAKEEFDRIAEQTVRLSKISNGLIKKTKSIIHDS